MSENKAISASKMKSGQSGEIIVINGGTGMISKLEALGVRIGAKLTKKSGFLGRGPIMISVGNTEIALGYGMASKIMVEVKKA